MFTSHDKENIPNWLPVVMKKVLSYFAKLFAGVCLIAALFFSYFYYTLYHDVVTDTASAIKSFDQRLAALEGHKSRELTPVHIWGIISTSNQPLDEHLLRYNGSEKHPDDYYEAINSKIGPFIRPELRLSNQSEQVTEYNIQVSSQFGSVADVWLSHADPYSNLTNFEEFRVYAPNGTNVVKLIARAKPGTMVKVRFSLVVLCQR